MAKVSILDEHVRRNRTTHERWDTMAPHRARVMRMIQDARGETAEASLCLLGAGNGNDVDLAQLARDFARIVLIDLDEEALHRGIERVPQSRFARIEPHGSVDLTGLLATLESWRGDGAPSDGDISAAINLARAAPAPAVGSFDVVVSTCVLTQLIDSVCMGLPAQHPRHIDLVMAVRNRHLEMIAELLKPGGVGVLITDFVSTETAPEIAQLDEMQFADATVTWLQQRNFFTGANPFAIREHLQNSPGTAPHVESVQVATPWRWDIGPKQFAVSAVLFRRAV